MNFMLRPVCAAGEEKAAEVTLTMHEGGLSVEQPLLGSTNTADQDPGCADEGFREEPLVKARRSLTRAALCISSAQRPALRTAVCECMILFCTAVN